jgi:hypothetical protein
MQEFALRQWESFDAPRETNPPYIAHRGIELLPYSSITALGMKSHAQYDTLTSVFPGPWSRSATTSLLTKPVSLG